VSRKTAWKAESRSDVRWQVLEKQDRWVQKLKAIPQSKVVPARPGRVNESRAEIVEVSGECWAPEG
jgi:hypothetical protein